MFRGLRQIFVIFGLVTTLIYCAHQPLATLDGREVASAQTAADFKAACQNLAQVRGYKTGICEQVHLKFFSKIPPGKSLAEFSPKDLGAPQQKIDSKIRFVIFNDANGASALSYCYFVFKGAIDTQSILPTDLNLASSGFSISGTDVGAYENWIETTEAGKICKTKVEQDSGYALPSATKELGTHLALVGVNPLAALNGGFVDMKTLNKEMQLSLNHGRIYAYIQACPKLEAWGQKQWLSMSEQDRKVIRSKLTAYKWDDVQVAGRQYIAFTFERDPNQVLSLTKGCEL